MQHSLVWHPITCILARLYFLESILKYFPTIVNSVPPTTCAT